MDEEIKVPADFNPRLRKRAGGGEIFDPVRRKFVRLTPEEGVRQYFVHYMITVLHYPGTLMVVEGSVSSLKQKKRFDILVYDATGRPRVIVECKAPGIQITQAVFDQAAGYNLALKADYLIVTNGHHHYACRIDHEGRSYRFLPSLPLWEELQCVTG